MPGQEAVELFAQTQDFFGLNFNVGGLALRPAERLMQVDGGVGQCVAVALRSGGEKHRAKRGGDADGDGGHRGRHLLHGIVNRQAGVNLAAGRVDVHLDQLVGVFLAEKEKLGHDHVRHLIVDGRADKDDAVLEQKRVNIISPFAPPGRFDHHWNKIVWNLHFIVLSSCAPDL